ncbi:hypothetical protein [Paraburkholderia dipogonis]|nr:hypothetical protein [Paraburkholderia dipogonis]
MRNKQTQIHPSALGGYTLEGPFYRRRSLVDRINGFLHWLGA